MWSERARRAVLGVVALVAVQVIAVGIYVAVEGTRGSTTAFRSETLRGDNEAPNIELERADGTRLFLHEIAGDVRLVHFWATWCPPCVAELPGLLETSRTLATQGLVLVAISMDEDWDAIRHFFKGRVPAEVYRAVEEDAHNEFDVFSLPDTYQIARDNRFVLRYGGARDWKSALAVKHLSAQLRE